MIPSPCMLHRWPAKYIIYVKFEGTDLLSIPWWIFEFFCHVASLPCTHDPCMASLGDHSTSLLETEFFMCLTKSISGISPSCASLLCIGCICAFQEPLVPLQCLEKSSPGDQKSEVGSFDILKVCGEVGQTQSMPRPGCLFKSCCWYELYVCLSAAISEVKAMIALWRRLNVFLSVHFAVHHYVIQWLWGWFHLYIECHMQYTCSCRCVSMYTFCGWQVNLAIIKSLVKSVSEVSLRWSTL